MHLFSNKFASCANIGAIIFPFDSSVTLWVEEMWLPQGLSPAHRSYRIFQKQRTNAKAQLKEHIQKKEIEHSYQEALNMVGQQNIRIVQAF